MKIGDRLLPMTTEEESTFQTLQEVEEVCHQQIKFAHVNRELPKVDNPTWKTDSEITLNETENGDDAVECEGAPDETPRTSATATQGYIGHKIPEEFLVKAGLIGNNAEDVTRVESLYQLNADGSTCGMFFDFFSKILILFSILFEFYHS